MLRITLTQDNGFPPATPLSHDFDERGGTIGRDASNALALPDPNRHISRMQAQIGHDGESYILTDHGGNPTSLNGRPLGKGVRASLHDGDEIGIADCVLRVEIVTGASPAGSAAPSPASDPLGLFAPPPAQAAITPPPTTAKSSSPQSTPYDEDPFAVFVPPAKPATPDTPETPAAHGIDPFAPTARPPADPDSNRAGADPLGIGGITGAERPSSLDALFGLDAAGSGHDPFAGSPLGDPAHAPIPSDRESDPFALFGSDAPPDVVPSAGNDSPLLHDAFAPPKPIEAAPPEAASSGESRAPGTPATSPNPLPSTPPGGVVSWATPAPGPDSAREPDPATAAEAVTRIAPRPASLRQTPDESAPPRQPVAADATAEKTEPPPTAPPSSADADALLAAFARGIGLPGLSPAGGMTPEFMEHIGGMLREAVQGTVELLIARAATKREVRADVTMIVSKNNNPLKFSPDVDFALMQLLVPPGSGFMPPTEAMRDAYDDLRAHQIGFVAGLRAALASVLNRFTPAELETRLTTRTLLDSVLPANRKAKLWDLYEQRYSEISREAEDDFHSLFGREFLKAYEAQIAQLQRGRE